MKTTFTTRLAALTLTFLLLAFSAGAQSAPAPTAPPASPVPLVAATNMAGSNPAPPRIIRLGVLVTNQLGSDQLVAAINRIAMTNAEEVWAISGVTARGGILFQAFCEPVSGTPELRRGAILFLRGGIAATAPGQPVFMNLLETNTYAQVGVAGRDFNRIEGDHDILRPFQVTGQFTDAELLSLCKFVRSSPSWVQPSVRRGGGGPSTTVAVTGKEPIEQVERKEDNSVVVYMLRDEVRSRQQQVEVREQTGEWNIVRIVNPAGAW